MPDILPQAYESSEVTGKITDAAAEATGLRAGTRVIAGAGDQAASAIGNGIVEAWNSVVHDWHFGRCLRVFGEAGL